MGTSIDKVQRDNVYEALFKLLPFVFYKDVSGVYLGGNDHQAKAFGLSDSSGFIGKNIFEILHDQEAARQIELVDNQIMRSGQPLVLEDTIDTPFGKKIFLAQKQPMLDTNGKATGLIGFAVDITKIKTAQRQAELEKEKIQQANHQLEIEYYKKLTEQQAQFQKAANQVRLPTTSAPL